MHINVGSGYVYENLNCVYVCRSSVSRYVTYAHKFNCGPYATTAMCMRIMYDMLPMHINVGSGHVYENLIVSMYVDLALEDMSPMHTTTGPMPPPLCV